MPQTEMVMSMSFSQKPKKWQKNQNLSNFAQIWRAWPSRVFRNMLWSWGKNLELWGVFLQFWCQAPPLCFLEFFLYGLQFPPGKLIELLIMPAYPPLKVQISICILQLLFQVIIYPLKPCFSIFLYLLGEQSSIGVYWRRATSSSFCFSRALLSPMVLGLFLLG